MRKSGRQNFIAGAFILTISTFIVKIIGMLYKIPLGNLLSGIGMASFNIAYNIFTPIYSLMVSGFPAAISKMVSEYKARGEYSNIKKLVRSSFALMFSLGIIGFAILFFGADVLTSLFNNPEAALSVKAIAPALFFCTIMVVYRGYYQGLENMFPTAVSQVIESLLKLLCGVSLAYITVKNGMAEFEASHTVFGILYDSPEKAYLAVMPFASAASLIGVSISTAAGAVFLFLRRLLVRDDISASACGNSKSGGQIIKDLLKLALPVCLTSALALLTSLIDLATIMNRLSYAISRSGSVIINMYAQYLPKGLAVSEIPKFLYGSYSYTTSLSNLIPSITLALSISALPMLTHNWTSGGILGVSGKVKSVIKLSALVAIPAGLGMSALAKPILMLLYPAMTGETAIAAGVLKYMGIAGVLIGVTSTTNSVFQALGKPVIPAKLMLIGAVIKTVSNYFLIAIPHFNIKAVAFGTILCYAYILISSLIKIEKLLHMDGDLFLIFAKPLICGILCAVSAAASYDLLARHINLKLACLFSIAVAALFYAFSVLTLKIISKNEVLMLPNGKKVAKMLEKLCFLR